VNQGLPILAFALGDGNGLTTAAIDHDRLNGIDPLASDLLGGCLELEQTVDTFEVDVKAGRRLVLGDADGLNILTQQVTLALFVIANVLLVAVIADLMLPHHEVAVLPGMTPEEALGRLLLEVALKNDVVFSS